MDIKALIQKGENQEVEFKASLSLLREGLEDLCAMLNTDHGGGSILFGVKDDKVVKGISSDDENNFDNVQKKIKQNLDRFDPKVTNVSIDLEPVDDQKVVLLSAGRDKNVPYYEFKGKAYLKVGSSKRALTVEEKSQLTRKRKRDYWNGPWKCDKCGSIVGMLVSISITDKGVEKSYECDCGGEYYPV